MGQCRLPSDHARRDSSLCGRHGFGPLFIHLLCNPGDAAQAQEPGDLSGVWRGLPGNDSVCRCPGVLPKRRCHQLWFSALHHRRSTTLQTGSDYPESRGGLHSSGSFRRKHLSNHYSLFLCAGTGHLPGPLRNRRTPLHQAGCREAGHRRSGSPRTLLSLQSLCTGHGIG